ncbi:MAG: F0F1 ATP synthase subunit alpha, partial [Nitrospinae bacterium]|nr:F0F1 ATP synthase subunit alpha [Nitrospinota bacterium]
TQAQLHRGERLVELLKQDQYKPLSAVKQIVSIFSGVRGLVDDIPVGDIKKFENGLLNFMEDKHKAIMDKIEEAKKLDDETEAQLKSAIEEFRGLFKS